ncbi:MAG: hypothetical protein WA417_13865 [Stellaceae bacterium]
MIWRGFAMPVSVKALTPSSPPRTGYGASAARRLQRWVGRIEKGQLQLHGGSPALQTEQLDAALILNFLGHFECQGGNGPVTRNLRLSAIKALIYYVEYQVPSTPEQVGQIRAIPTKRSIRSSSRI